MSVGRPYRVLFLCTGNSARSILAEFILNARAHGRFEAFSAGAQPTGQVNPFVAEILSHQFRADAAKARSKSWREFEGQHFDFIITLCDKARETCPAWPGHPVTAHWGSPDPAAVEGTDERKRHAVLEVATLIATRIGLFTSLRESDLHGMRLGEIGDTLSTS
ncbi:MAG: arsenate reductase ArsC [Opitutaceae bacterium]|nr:arsenate reductase ArsC [Opitutaceae bacterium]